MLYLIHTQFFMPVHKLFGVGTFFAALATMLMGVMAYEPGGRSTSQHYATSIAVLIWATGILTAMAVRWYCC
jgi:ABC-type Na+ efflux pump permease subunit